jgi:exopolyphosphatase/guanosine-5'-triphosphate,3'-diphosphate pyrophosphatase
VAETDPQCGFRVIEDMKETTRLGTGVYTEGRLKSGAVDRSLTALERMRAVAEGHHVDRLRAVGTSAIREAANSREFLDLARRQAGVHIEVIDADREARLAFSSVASAFELSDTRMAVADLGGGSMELIFGSGGVVDAVYALPLGAVRLTERHLGDGGAGQGHEEMVHAIDRVLDEIIGKPIYKPDLLIGTGGTFTCLAKVGILRGAPSGGAGRFPFAVRGYQLRRKEISALLEWLREMSPEQRREVPGLSSQRSEIIVAGVCVIERVLRYLKIDRLRVHDGGIRDGLLAELIDELSFDPRVFRPEITGVVPSARAFAERCRFEKPHSEHVAALALEIFDQLSVQVPDASGTWARRECRELLHAAGLVHDVGILIAWKRHHRHGSDMIVHGDLPGLSRREIEVLACAARYHRKSGPRLRHASFRKLGDDDQRLVRHLVGILRIADGLDRLHSQNVRGVRVEAEPGRVRFEVMADERPGVNLRYARAKADVFESAFHVKTDFTWAQADAAPTSTEIDP